MVVATDPFSELDVAELSDDDKERLKRLKRAQEKTDQEERRQEAIQRYEKLHREWKDGAPNWDDVVDAWNEIAEAEGEPGGLPMPGDVPLVLESQFPFPEFQGACKGKYKSDIDHEKQQQKAYELWEQAGRPEGDGVEFWLEAEEYVKNPKKKNPKDRYQLVNRWRSRRMPADIMIWYDQQEKKYTHHVEYDSWIDRLNNNIKTKMVGQLWSLRAEQKAQEKLRKHITHDQYRSYMLVGQFFEDSKRSRLRYLFRRSRPTIVFSPNKDWDVLCCLCQHGTGYYAQTWAGVLTPTDDVLIHLFEMRTNEHGYWKKSNQHPPYSELSGI